MIRKPAEGITIRFGSADEAEWLASLSGLGGDPVPVAVIDVLVAARRVFVAQEAATGALVGLAALSEIDGILSVESLCVLPEWRRRGVGSALLKAVEDFGQWACFAQALAVPRSAAATALLFRRGWLTVDSVRMPVPLARFGDGLPVVAKRL